METNIYPTICESNVIWVKSVFKFNHIVSMILNFKNTYGEMFQMKNS